LDLPKSQSPARDTKSSVGDNTSERAKTGAKRDARSGGRTLLYRASKHDCDPCPLKRRCCPKEPARKIPRDVNEAARDLARGLMQTECSRVSARQRKMIETGFADLKRNLGLTRLRLRGLTGANDQFLLAATVLRRLAKAIWPSPEPTTSPTTA
jgi:hypothetical protein